MPRRRGAGGRRTAADRARQRCRLRRADGVGRRPGRLGGLPTGGAAVNPAARLQTFHIVAGEVDAAGRRAQVAGAVLVTARGHAEVFDGQGVRVGGKLARLRQVGPGGTTGYADRLERQGVVAEMSAGSVQPLDSTPGLSLSRLVAGGRGQLVTALRAVACPSRRRPSSSARWPASGGRCRLRSTPTWCRAAWSTSWPSAASRLPSSPASSRRWRCRSLVGAAPWSRSAALASTPWLAAPPRRPCGRR